MALLRKIGVLFSKDKIFLTRLKKLTGFFPSDIKPYKTAFTHRSSLGSGSKPGQYNERLEFLGDSVLSLVISEYLYEKFPSEHEGTLTKIKSVMVSRKTLNAIADSMELRDMVKVKLGQDPFPLSIGGNALEALIGAIYVDKGLAVSRKFIINKILVPYYNIEEILHSDENYKSKLIEWSQKHKVRTYFKVLEESTEDHHRVFRIGLFVQDELREEATAKSKKVAEQECAKKLFLSGFIEKWQS
ncbi:MAG: ribonuclease III [Flavobacteriales bacterium]